MENEKVCIDIGAGRKRDAGYKTLDKTQFVDGNGNHCVDIVCDIEKKALPFADESVDVIRVDNVLEHLKELIYPLNEFHRVLKRDGHLIGMVPVANTSVALRDPTHMRVFVRDTFAYFTGQNPAKPDRPGHPKYADYGIAPWIENKLIVADDLIHFDLTPRKITFPPYGRV